MKKILFMIIVLLCASVVFAGLPAGTTKEAFMAEMARRYDLHRTSAPHSIEGIRATMNQAYTDTIDCSGVAGATVGECKISVTTQLVDFTSNPALKGWYEWRCSVPETVPPGGTKDIECENYISFNLAHVQVLPENNLFIEVQNVGLYYHEFLHGQLQLDAMGTQAWKDKCCKCNFTLDNIDLDHVTIDPLETQFETAVETFVSTEPDPRWTHSPDVSSTTTTDTTNTTVPSEFIPEFTVIGAILVAIIALIVVYFMKK